VGNQLKAVLAKTGMSQQAEFVSPTSPRPLGAASMKFHPRSDATLKVGRSLTRHSPAVMTHLGHAEEKSRGQTADQNEGGGGSTLFTFTVRRSGNAIASRSDREGDDRRT